MQTVNHQFHTAGEPYKRFVKTVDHPITGWRLDPDKGHQIEFILVSLTPEFRYEDEALEIYSERELKFLQQRNRYLFESGLLKEYTGETDTEVDMSNVMTDDEVFTLASTRLPNELKSKLSGVTSAVTVRRVLLTAKEIGRPARVLAVIDARLKELST